MKHIRFINSQINNVVIRHRQPPNQQSNYYSNQQYHLQIANKHQLLIYNLFEALIEYLNKNERYPSSSSFLNPRSVSHARTRD